jgi:LytS/YehU family sensor histidine kinase
LENAVKHNIVSPEKPLTISLRIEDNALVVQNNLQPKRILEHSSGLGLENLRKRYAYFTATPIQINEDDTSFCVRLPIIKGDLQ